MLACALTTGAASAHAQPALPALPAVVALELAGCDSRDDAAAVARLTATELRADGVQEVVPSSTDTEAIARIEVVDACAGPTVTVRVIDLATDKRLERQVPLSDVVGEARMRVVAFAVAALLRASWAELVLPDAPRPRAVPSAIVDAATERAMSGLERRLGHRLSGPTPQIGSPAGPLEVEAPREAEAPAAAPAPAAPDRTAPPTAPSARPGPAAEATASGERASDEESDEGAGEDWQLGGALTARVFFQQPTGALGARVFAGIGWFRAGLTGAGGFVQDALGEAVYGLLTADAEATPVTLALGDPDAAQLAMRVRASIGWVRLQGQTARADVDAASLDAFVFGGEVVGALRVPLLDTLALELELALGAMTGAAARADGRAIATAEGLYGRVGLGLAR